MLPAKQQTTVPVFESVFGAADGWNLYVQPDAGGTISRNNGTGTIDVTKIGSDAWHVQLVKAPVKIKKDSRYLVTIKASSDVPVSFTNYVGKNSDPWNSYSGYKSISLTSIMSDYTYSFVMTSPTDELARVVFDLGSKVAKISIASVKIEEVKEVVSAYSNALSDRLKIYPNPVQEYLTISGGPQDQSIKIVDVQGRVMIENKYRNEEKVNVSGLAAGTYFLQVVSDRSWGVKKFVKK